MLRLRTDFKCHGQRPVAAAEMPPMYFYPIVGPETQLIATRLPYQAATSALHSS